MLFVKQYSFFILSLFCILIKLVSPLDSRQIGQPLPLKWLLGKHMKSPCLGQLIIIFVLLFINKTLDKVGDTVKHEDENAGTATIESFELNEELNEVKIITNKGWAHIDFIKKV